MEIIDSPNAHKLDIGVTRALTPHKSSTCGAEIVGHGVVGANCLDLSETLEVFAATDEV